MREKFGFFICALLILQSGNGLAKEERYSLRLTSLGWFHQISIVGVGVPQHGGTIVGTVIYPKANPEACYPFDKFGISFKSSPGFPTRVLLVDRGDCFFALKAWNAQKAGAAAILVADYWDEPLTTMDTPEEDYFSAKYLQEITIPSALITKELGDKIKKAIHSGQMVNINLTWRESIPNPDERVEYEFWTNSNDDRQIEFVKNFKGAAQILEQKGYTRFTPHYMTWYCPEAFILSKNCRSQCINHGRYCSPDPQQDFSTGYDGKDVVVQNLRQACLFKVANESGKPWLWWDYVTDFANRCPMKQNKYTKGCADQVIRSLGVDISKIDECVGDVEADVNNPVLKAEQEAQIGKGSREDVTMLPTLVINNRTYRGKLEKGAVLKAICAGFEENEEPAICFRQDIEADKLLQRTYESFQGSETLQRTYESFQGAEPLQSNKETYESLQNNAADAQPLQDNMETYVEW